MDGAAHNSSERCTEDHGTETGPDLPYATHGHCTVAFDSHFTVLTGGVGDTGNGSFYVHDWIKNQW